MYGNCELIQFLFHTNGSFRSEKVLVRKVCVPLRKIQRSIIEKYVIEGENLLMT
jgi:hypothetical protein